MYLLLFLLLVLIGLLCIPYKYSHTDSITAEVIQHSKSAHGVFAITYLLKYPRFIHSEMMTHKDFSRSAASSRAIPVMKMFSQVWNNPAMPVSWGQNVPGMQAKSELAGLKRTVAIRLWVYSGRLMCCMAYFFSKIGLHKQVANRILEPWQLITVTLTTSKLANFFNLRVHPDAQPEIQLLADKMQLAYLNSKAAMLAEYEWHLPWVRLSDLTIIQNIAREEEKELSDILIQVSAARCARSSYGTFDGEVSIAKDLKLFNRLVTAKPVHASPAEHQVTPDRLINGEWEFPHLHGNMTGWIQHRKLIPDHYVED